MSQPPHFRRRVTYVLLGLGLALSIAFLAPQLTGEETASTPVPTQSAALFAPQLLSPVDGLQTYPTNLTLEWSWPQGLGEDQLYTVRFWREGDPPGDIAYTADTRLGISGFLESSQPGRFYWQVAVIQLNAEGVFESMGSGWSQVWQMERIPPSPVPTETPVPVIPTPTPTPNPQYTEPDPYDRPPNDVESLIGIRTGRGAETKREQLIEILWGEDGLPDTLPEVEEDIEIPETFSDLPNLRQIDRLTITMELGIESYPLLFHPEEANGRLILYHEGSDGDLSYGLETIQFFLERGYTVLGLEMPLLGKNNNPIVDIPHVGQVQLPGYLHFHLYYVEALIEQGSILKLFIEPVVIALNYADTLDFENYAMIGISGGGWATHLAAAVDTRITRSYPVAGSQPEFVRFEGRYALTDLMAYVQLLPGVFPLVNYLELYILGAYGEGRKEMMVINQFDPCCFGGLRYLSWYDAVLERMDRLGAGEFEIFLDVTHEQHIISPAARQAVLDDLETE